MKEDPPETKAELLLQLSEEVSRIAGSLAQLSIGTGGPLHQDYAPSNSNEPDVRVEWVSWLIRARRNRVRYLPPGLFADPAWDILLDLLRAELTHERISVSSASIAANVPPTTGLRWLKALVEQGLVLRECDMHDARRTFVVLSPDTSKALRRYFRDIVGMAQFDTTTVGSTGGTT